MAYSETRIVIGGLAHVPVLIFIANYIKGVYKKKIQAEIESYKDPEDEDKRDTIQAQDVLMLDRISI